MTQTTPELIDWQPGQTARHGAVVVTLIGFPTSAGYTPARLGHRCGLGRDCRRWDVDGGTVAFAWECELTEIDTDNVQADNVIVRLAETRGIYRVTVEYASTGQQIPEFCWTTDDRDAAYAALARRVAAFESGVTVEQARDIMTAHTALPQLATARTDRVRSTPVAKGHQLDMSPSQAAAILIAGVGGTIDRGAPMTDGVPTGRLTDPQIRAAAARGWVKPIVAPGPQRRIIGCQPTIAGWTHARDLSQPANTQTTAA